jgi:hypothetical protein
MNRLFIAVVSALLLVGVSACKPLGRSDEAEIEETFRTLMTAFGAADVAALEQVLEPPDEMREMMGLSALSVTARTVASMDRMKGVPQAELRNGILPYHIISIEVTGDRAHLEYLFKSRPPEAFAFVRVDGKWRVAIGENPDCRECQRRLTTPGWRDSYTEPDWKTE